MGQEVEALELPCTASGNVKCTTTLENNLSISDKVKQYLLFDPGIPLLGIY